MPIFRMIPLVAGLLLSLTAMVHAAPPKLDWMHPSGVGRATETTITLADPGAWPVQVWIDDPQGITIEPHKDKGRLTIKTDADAHPGVRWLRLLNAEGASPMRPLMIGTLPEIEAKSTGKAAQEVALPAVVNGRLEKRGAVDLFRIRLKRGQMFIASMTANETLGSPMDGVMQLCDADGHVITQNDDERGLDPQIVFEARNDGDHLVRVFAFPAVPDSSIAFAGGANFIYRLTLTTGPFIDHALPLAAKASADGSPAADGRVAVHGWNLPQELMTLSPRVSNGEAERGMATLAHAQIGNTIELPLSRGAVLVAGDGSSITQPQAIPLPVMVSGRIESLQTSQVFKFTGRKGQTIRVEAASQALGFAMDPVLRVMDLKGEQIVENDDDGRAGRDAAISFKPAADGDYLVSVRDLHGRGGFRFVYRLSAAVVEPDFAITLAADSFSATAGKALEIPVTIERKDGFTGEITVRIEGLPGEAEAPVAISKMKDPGEKLVKLMLTAKGEPRGGPLRIIAEAGDQRRLATFATATGARHVQVWLTVVK